MNADKQQSCPEGQSLGASHWICAPPAAQAGGARPPTPVLQPLPAAVVSHEMATFEQETRPTTATVPKQKVLRQPPGTQSASVEQPWLNIGIRHCPPKHTPGTPPGRVHPLPFGVVAMQEHWPPEQPNPLDAQLNPQLPQLSASV